MQPRHDEALGLLADALAMRRIPLLLASSSLWIACAAETPTLRRLSPDGIAIDNRADTRSLAAAWQECRRIAPGKKRWLACSAVNEELRRRRQHRVNDVYESSFPALTTSCDLAARAIAAAEGFGGPLDLGDGVAPPWSELSAREEYISRDYPDQIDPRYLVDHATALLKCGDGAALARLFDVCAREVQSNRVRHPETPQVTSDSLAASLVGTYPRPAFALLDRGVAPPALKKALAGA